ncbi:MAG: 50S ribosomal protein L35 [Gammaproteobacteria bacterium]|nr:50S ribosomal protein L35 [Gammaproteobacteria bacterium]MYF53486.1 50S ribosomal protein L35 [Gammaproteobacteria bacterium]MYK43617.1 50S ribosomal protein L35 [Gammaproteobacteria bacterium]
MPKIKSHSGAVKRFRKTANGYKHKRTGKNHLQTKKSQQRKRNLRGFKEISAQDVKKIDNLLPYDGR